MSVSPPDPGASEFLGRLATLVSHELRTPLTVIVGYAELLELREDPRTQAGAGISIRRAAGRLSQMIDDLLVAAALDAGQVFVEAKAVKLRAALTDACERLDGRDTCHLDLVGASDPLVEVDSVHLRQILLNALRIAGADKAAIEAVFGEERGLALLTLAPASAPGADERAAGLALSVAERLSRLAGGSLSLEVDALTLQLPLAARGSLAVRCDG